MNHFLIISVCVTSLCVNSCKKADSNPPAQVNRDASTGIKPELADTSTIVNQPIVDTTQIITKITALQGCVKDKDKQGLKHFFAFPMQLPEFNDTWKICLKEDSGIGINKRLFTEKDFEAYGESIFFAEPFQRLFPAVTVNKETIFSENGATGPEEAVDIYRYSINVQAALLNTDSTMEEIVTITVTKTNTVEEDIPVDMLWTFISKNNQLLFTGFQYGN